MVLEAPGTYHHSLIVGNLSDSACLAVGANGLLARIGAYYHDIGNCKNQSILLKIRILRRMFMTNLLQP